MKPRPHTILSTIRKIAILLALLPASVHAAIPLLAFSDLINGPSTGLGDGLGSGTIVTLWGYNLGPEQGASKVYFTDSSGKLSEVSHVYYWKAADGKLPGGPADLYSSHGMFEIAVSIPNSPNGLGELFVVAQNKESNRIPFTVRGGNILHVKSTGSNTTGSGTFALPYATVSALTSGAIKKAAPGDIIYVHDSIEEINNVNGAKLYGIYSSGHQATGDNQTAIVAYPNSQPLSRGENIGIGFYLSYGIAVSKYRAQAGNYDMPATTSTTILPKSTEATGIQTNMSARYVGNEVTQIPGKCVSGQQGAISGNARTFDSVSNVKLLGNYIHDWGCDQSSHFGHVTYLSNRSDGARTVSAWEYAYNYLADNKSKFGLHSYDETFSGTCGDVTGTISIHDNIVINQKGPGINFGALNNSGICWTTSLDAYNNILINTGLGPPDENGIASSAIRITDKGLKSTVNIYNNTVFNWSEPQYGGRMAAIEVSGNQDNVTINMDNNIFRTDQDVYFERSDAIYADNINGQNNSWYFSAGGTPLNAKVPTWDTAPILKDPKITHNTKGRVRVDENAPIIGQATPKGIAYDVTGEPRGTSPTIGAKEFSLPAPPQP